MVDPGARFSVVLERGPLISVQWSPAIVLHKPDAHLLMRAIREASPGRRVHLLMFLNGMTSLSQEALARFVADAPLSAVGLVGPSILDQALIELYSEIYRPPYPARYFDGEGPARTWLSFQPHDTGSP